MSSMATQVTSVGPKPNAAAAYEYTCTDKISMKIQLFWMKLKSTCCNVKPARPAYMVSEISANDAPAAAKSNRLFTMATHSVSHSRTPFPELAPLPRQNAVPSASSAAAAPLPGTLLGLVPS